MENIHDHLQNISSQAGARRLGRDYKDLGLCP